jgi:hypothetical protein
MLVSVLLSFPFRCCSSEGSLSRVEESPPLVISVGCYGMEERKRVPAASDARNIDPNRPV